MRQHLSGEAHGGFRRLLVDLSARFGQAGIAQFHPTRLGRIERRLGALRDQFSASAA
jgi:hypothetical protein